MLFYLIFLLSLAVCAGRYNIAGHKLIKPHSGFILACFIVFIVAVCRFNIGYDYGNYYSFMYPRLDNIVIDRSELFPRLFYYIADFFNLPFLFFLFLAIINYMLVFHIIEKYSLSKYESIIVFVSLFYLTTLSTVRQGAAVPVLFWGFKYIKDKKLFKYILVCIIAFNFHRTAILGLVLYPLYHMKKYGIVIFLSSIMVVFVRLIFPKILEIYFPYFLQYLSIRSLAESSGNFMKYFYLILFVYCLINILVNKDFKKNKGYISIITVGVIFPFIMGGHTGMRVAEYFFIYFVLLYPNANRKKNIKRKAIMLFIFYAYFFIYLFVSVYINKSTAYVPYKIYFLTAPL
jgi:hypothetical protein